MSLFTRASIDTEKPTPETSINQFFGDASEWQYRLRTHFVHGIERVII